MSPRGYQLASPHDKRLAGDQIVCGRCGSSACAANEWRCGKPGPLVTRFEFEQQNREDRP